MDVGTSEDGAFWLAFLRSLSARGLSGVDLVISDAHRGLRGRHSDCVRRCELGRDVAAHFMTNLLTRVPRKRPALGGYHGAHHLPAAVCRRWCTPNSRGLSIS